MTLQTIEKKVTSHQRAGGERSGVDDHQSDKDGAKVEAQIVREAVGRGGIDTVHRSENAMGEQVEIVLSNFPFS